MKKCLLPGVILIFIAFNTMADNFEKNVIKTSGGDLVITFIGHGSLLLNFNNKNIYIDPYSKLADYAKLPKADLVLLTHEHRDHLDPEALNAVKTDKTIVVGTANCAQALPCDLSQ